jgi:DNA-binding NtrC family response regulator
LIATEATELKNDSSGTAKQKILVLEDESVLRETICNFFELRGYETIRADTCVKADQIWNTMRPDAAIVDYSLPDGKSLEFLSRWKSISPRIPVLFLTGNGSIELAVQAVKLGAEQFLTKPTDLSILHTMLQRSMENARNQGSQIAEKTRRERGSIEPFLGTSSVIKRLEDLVSKFVATNRPILIDGETGTGKGVLARWIHENGPRSVEAFVDLNCGGLPSELLESELFGHERGAFTGATQAKAGLFEIADRGTVFLDEIGDMGLLAQAKLLKVIEDKRFRRLGHLQERTVDIRLIAATHRNLPTEVEKRNFRGDLYFRISTIPLTTPPLRDRAEDIPLLAECLLRNFSREFDGTECSMSVGAAKALKNYSWPGNIRELRNVLERAIILCEDRQIAEKDLHFEVSMRFENAESDSNATLEEMEKRHIQRVLTSEDWQVHAAAKRLHVPKSSLYQKILRFGLIRSETTKSQ